MAAAIAQINNWKPRATIVRELSLGVKGAAGMGMSLIDQARSAGDSLRNNPSIHNAFKAFLASAGTTKASEAEKKNATRSIRLFGHCCESYGWNITGDLGDDEENPSKRFCDTHVIEGELLDALLVQFFQYYLIQKVHLLPQTQKNVSQTLSHFIQFLHDKGYLPQKDTTLSLQAHCDEAAQAATNPNGGKTAMHLKKKRGDRATKVLKDFVEFVKKQKQVQFATLGIEKGETREVGGYFEVEKIGDGFALLGDFALEGVASENAELAPFKTRLPNALLKYLQIGDQIQMRTRRVHDDKTDTTYWVPVDCTKVYPDVPPSPSSPSSPVDWNFPEHISTRGNPLRRQKSNTLGAEPLTGVLDSFDESKYDKDEFWKVADNEVHGGGGNDVERIWEDDEEGEEDI